MNASGKIILLGTTPYKHNVFKSEMLKAGLDPSKFVDLKNQPPDSVWLHRTIAESISRLSNGQKGHLLFRGTIRTSQADGKVIQKEDSQRVVFEYTHASSPGACEVLLGYGAIENTVRLQTRMDDAHIKTLAWLIGEINNEHRKISPLLCYNLLAESLIRHAALALEDSPSVIIQLETQFVKMRQAEARLEKEMA